MDRRQQLEEWRKKKRKAHGNTPQRNRVRVFSDSNAAGTPKSSPAVRKFGQDLANSPLPSESAQKKKKKKKMKKEATTNPVTKESLGRALKNIELKEAASKPAVAAEAPSRTLSTRKAAAPQRAPKDVPSKDDNAKKSAKYWVARARVEEDAKDYEAVVKIYEKAQRIGAEPVKELDAGLRAFCMRVKHVSQAAAKKNGSAPPAAEEVVESTEARAGPVVDDESSMEGFTISSSFPTESSDNASTVADDASLPSQFQPVDAPKASPARAKKFTPRKMKGFSQPARRVAVRSSVHKERSMGHISSKNVLDSAVRTLTPMKATAKNQHLLGDGETQVMSPVRRSARATNNHLKRTHDMATLEETGYAFAPNEVFDEDNTLTPAAKKQRIERTPAKNFIMTKSAEECVGAPKNNDNVTTTEDQADAGKQAKGTTLGAYEAVIKRTSKKTGQEIMTPVRRSRRLRN